MGSSADRAVLQPGGGEGQHLSSGSRHMWESSPPSQCLFQRSQIPSPTEDWLPPHTLQPHLPDFFGWYQLSLTGHGKRTLSWAFTGTEGRAGYSHTCCVSISMDDITSQNLSPLICKADLLPSSPWAGCTQSISLSPPSSLPPSIPFSTSLFFTKLYQEAGTHL